ncbi:hypothetical protein HY3_01155 [Hyphomonas pacifica]|uniref:Uncharacterized protein n=1 Tax=Hyphomonas pacifica TaxID=1280941 RepID=A0A8B2PPM9_9PROT|nr:hypothetical protein HY3_01155 [Hyphomonas pacifica]
MGWSGSATPPVHMGAVHPREAEGIIGRVPESFGPAASHVTGRDRHEYTLAREGGGKLFSQALISFGKTCQACRIAAVYVPVKSFA